MLDHATIKMKAWFGDWWLGKGQDFRETSRRFESGAKVLYDLCSDKPGSTVLIDLPGDACREVGDEALRGLIVWALRHDGHCTRIDLRLDFHGESLDWIDEARGSCERGELCRCRTWKAEEPRTAAGDFLGRGLTLGKRGKSGSGRYIRFYDKGLESGEKPARQWERFEGEFTGEAAREVGRNLAESQDWTTDARALLLGAVDFRVKTDQVSRFLDRRPLSAWWQRLVDGLVVRIARRRRTRTTLETYTGYIRRQVAPKLRRMMSDSRLSLPAVLAHLGFDSAPIGRSDDLVVRQFCAGLGLPSSFGAEALEQQPLERLVGKIVKN